MIYTAVCFGYSLTEEFGEHFESVDGGDLFQGDCVEVNDLKDVLEIEENQDFDKIDVFFGVFLCGDSECSTFDEYQFDFDDVNIRLKKLIDRLKEKHESPYKQLILDKIAREIPKILVLKRKC